MTPELTEALVAAGGHTGAMIALIPTQADAQRLAVDGGESADELHVTLAYLGEAAMIPNEVREALVDCVAKCVTQRSTVMGNAFSVNLFNPEDKTITAGGKEPCVVLGVGGSQLQKIRGDVVYDVQRVLVANGVDFPQQHVPWIPHITLLYTSDADLTYFTDRMGPITFDAIRLAFGDDVYDVPLGESTPVTASGEIEFSKDGELIVPNVLIDLHALAKERDVNAPGGSGHQLRNYWTKGAGATKIRWGTPGDFTRCVANLGKYVKDPKGLCAEYHHDATGMWPGDKRNPGMNETYIVTAKYNPNQPRDKNGQWTDGPGGGGGGFTKIENLRKMNAADAKTMWAELSDKPHDVVVAYKKDPPYMDERLVTKGDKFEVQYAGNDATWKKYYEITTPKDLRTVLRRPKWEQAKEGETYELDQKKAEEHKKLIEAIEKGEYKSTKSSEERPPPAENLPASWTAGETSHEDAIADRTKAMSRRKNPWINDGDLQEAIANYTAAGYGPLNAAIRNDEKIVDEGAFGSVKTREYTSSIDKTMYPLPREITTFRQVGLNAFGLSNLNDIKALEGEEFFDKAYVSTSLNPLNSIDDDSSSPIRLRIKLPKGTRANYIADFSEFPEEKELLLGRGTRFKIDKVTLDEYGRALVEMQVIK